MRISWSSDVCSSDLWLFYDRWWGATLGGFALAWIVAFVVARRDVRRSGPALLALGGALVMAAVLVDDPSPLAWVLFWSAVATAALVSRDRKSTRLNSSH